MKKGKNGFSSATARKFAGDDLALFSWLISDGPVDAPREDIDGAYQFMRECQDRRNAERATKS